MSDAKAGLVGVPDGDPRKEKRNEPVEESELKRVRIE